MPYRSKIALVLMTLMLFGTCQISKKCCQSYDKSNTLCLTCPDGSNYFGNNCIMDLEGCAQYADCFSCSQCADGFKMTDSVFNGVKVQRCLKTII